MDHYLDDFIFAGRKGTEDCKLLMTTFIKLSEELGIPLVQNKTVGPTCIIEYLGFTIDTILMKVKIPEEKLCRLRTELEFHVSKHKITIKELESVSGLMSFCSRAIPSARAFIRRFYDLIGSNPNRKP
jgi:hypothetical protein